MKYVSSYYIEKLPNGIIHLLINTTEKGMYYHEYMLGEYFIEREDDNPATSNERVLKIPVEDFQMGDVKYHCSLRLQVGDQISFYYLPFDMVYDGKSHIIKEWKNTNNEPDNTTDTDNSK